MPTYITKIRFACGQHSNTSASDVLVTALKSSWEINFFEIESIKKVVKGQ